MASASVSFRISRSAEDLAGTLHLLSQRLVQLEQRLSDLEARQAEPTADDPAMLERLGNAERLLVDCRELLAGALEPALADPEHGEDPIHATEPDGIAAAAEALELSEPEGRGLWEEEDEGEELAA